MKTYQQFVLEAYDRASGRPHRGTDYKGRDYGGSVEDHERAKRTAKAIDDLQGGWLEREKAKKKKVEEELEIEESVRPGNVEKPLDKAAFKKRRRSLAGKEASADARKRGHEGKTWADSGRTYSPDEAKSRRKNMSDIHRSLSYGTAESPDDNEGYPAVKTKNPKKLRKQKAMGELGEEVVNETSLTRIMSKAKKGGMAIMSAQRGDKSKEENKARSRQLERDIRGAGLPGPTKVACRYTENPGTPQEKKVGEKSHIITPGKKGKRKFKKAIEKLGKKYNQDSVLLQRKGGGEATLKGTSKTSWPGEGKNVKIGSMKPGRTGEFDTKVKNKTFTVEN